MRNEIFISHRTEDAPVADMLKDFLVGTGIPNDRIFCSSLPGNDVHERIDAEVRSHLKHSAINILILSKAYYESAYCLNEAGVAWYTDEALAVPIGLPEIDRNSMVGFLNSDYKLRRVDDDNDIAFIYDAARERLGAEYVSHAVVTREIQKLKERFRSHISSRETSTKKSDNNSHMSSEATRGVAMTDAAIIMLLYAAEGDGTIIVTSTLDGSTFLTGGRNNMNRSQEPREIAKWDAAVQALLSEGYVVLSSNANHDTIYKVTDKGFTFSDRFKNAYHLDTSKTPTETLSDLLNHYRHQSEEQEQITQEIESYLSFDTYH